MKFTFYFFIIAQILNIYGVFAEKDTKDFPEYNPINWENIENNEKTLKKIIWKSYKDDKNYFEKTNLKNKSKENLDKYQKEIDLNQATKLRFRPAHQLYFDAQREGGSSRDMFLMGGKIDWMRGDWVYLTLQGLSAYEGGAGGYSEGNWGVGILGPTWNNWRLYGEMLIGAGGGGGVDSGSALLYKPSVGLEYNLNKYFSLQTGIGKVISKEGNLDANTLDASLIWRFGAPK